MNRFRPRYRNAILLALAASLALVLSRQAGDPVVPGAGESPPPNSRVETFARGASEARAEAIASGQDAVDARSVGAGAASAEEDASWRWSPPDDPVDGPGRELAPGFQAQSDLIAGAKVIEERIEGPDARGLVVRDALVRPVGGFDRLLRVHERWRDRGDEPPWFEWRELSTADEVGLLLVDPSAREPVEQRLLEMGLAADRIALEGTVVVVKPSAETLAAVDEVLALAEAHPEWIEAAAGFGILFASEVPDDPLFPRQWHLRAEGDRDIDGPEAWEANRGSADVVVAVLDTGVYRDHEDLAESVARAPAYKGTYSQGDGREGTRYDDPDGHGTAVAGVVAAAVGNGMGVAGVAPGVAILPMRVLDGRGIGIELDVAGAIVDAVKNGADVAVLSFAMPGRSWFIGSAIRFGADKGTMLVAAAGNYRMSIDQWWFSPASFVAPHLIAVAASDPDDRRASYSNYGSYRAAIAAPGTGIMTTGRGGGYKAYSGTSMAAPMVAGAYALLRSAYPDWTLAQLRERLLAGADRVPALEGWVQGQRRLNAATPLYLGIESHVSITELAVVDAGVPGATGDGDGIASPGETLALRVSALNRGTRAAPEVSTTVSLVEAPAGTELLDPVISWGALPSGQEVSATRHPLVRIPVDAPSPSVLRVRLETRDAEGRRWATTGSVAIHRFHLLHGIVRMPDGSVVGAGTRVHGSGVLEAEAWTDTAGRFSLRLSEGDNQVWAERPGTNGSLPIAVAVPHVGLLELRLARGILEVEPAALAATLLEDEQREVIARVANRGDHPLSVEVSVTGAAFVEPTETGEIGAQALARRSRYVSVPFRDGFESEASSYTWTGNDDDGAAVVADHFVEGERSLRVGRLENPEIAEGAVLLLEAGSRPAYVSFWVRSELPPGGVASILLEAPETWSLFWARAEGRQVALRLSVANEPSDNPRVLSGANGLWRHVELDPIDWEKKTYTLRVDGKVLVEQGKLLWYASSLAAIRVERDGWPPGQVWIDDVQVLEFNAGWVKPTVTSLVLAPGEERDLPVLLDARSLPPGQRVAEVRLFSNDPLRPEVTLPVRLEVLERPRVAPVATAARHRLDEDTALAFELEGFDADSDPFTFQLSALPARGSIRELEGWETAGPLAGRAITEVPHPVAPGQRLLYVPPPDAWGEGLESLVFHAVDRRDRSPDATVVFDVDAVPDVPLARMDHVSGPPGTVHRVAVLANDTDADGDTLQVVAVADPPRGSVTVEPDGTLTYVPDAGFQSGFDRFAIEVADPSGRRATSQVVVAAGGLARGPWSMPGRDATGAGWYPGRLGGKRFVKVWSLPVFGPEPVAIGGGLAFVTDRGGSGIARIRSVEIASGVQRWEVTRQGNKPSGAALDASRLYVAIPAVNSMTDPDRLLALDPATGTASWEFTIKGRYPTFSLPVPRVSGGVLSVIAANRFRFDFHDARTGALLGSPAVSYAADGYWAGVVPVGYEFLGVSDQELFAIRPDGTSKEWVFPLAPVSSTTASLPVVRDGFAVFRHSDINGVERLSRFDLQSRTLAWSIPVGSRVGGIPALGADRAYIVAGSTIRAHDLATGALARTYSAGPTQMLRDQPIVLEDAILASSAGSVLVWDLATGTLLQEIPGGGEISFADGALVVAEDYAVTCHAVEETGRRMPLVANLRATAVEDEPLPITLRGEDPDGQPLGSVIISLPGSGTLHQTTDGVTPGTRIGQVPTAIEHPGNLVIYVPARDDFGEGRVRFGFRMHNGSIPSQPAEVVIDIEPRGDPPVAYPDAVHLLPGKTLEGYDPTWNDREPDGDALWVHAVGEALRGAASVDAQGRVRYVPDDDFRFGKDRFQVTVRDASGATSTAELTIRMGQPENTPWTSAMGGPARTRHAPTRLGDGPWSESWKFPVEGSTFAPVIADGVVFQHARKGSGDSTLVAIDSVSGASRWTRTLRTHVNVGVPTWHSGELFVPEYQQGGGHSALALDANDGSTLWQSPAVSFAMTAPIAEDGRLRFSDSTRSYLVSLFRTEGSLEYATRASYPDMLAWAGDRLVGLPLGAIESWSPKTGLSLVRRAAGIYGLPSLSVAPAVHEDLVFALPNAPSGGFPMLEARGRVDLELRWSAQAGNHLSPGVAGDRVYAVDAGKLVARGVSNGRTYVEFALPPGAGTVTDFAVAEDRLVACTASATHVWDRRTGSLLGTLPVGGYVAVADGAIFVSSPDAVRRFARLEPSNAPPVAIAATIATLEDQSVPIRPDGLDPDGEALDVVIAVGPTRGRLHQATDLLGAGEPITAFPARITHVEGWVVYVPDPDVSGDGVDSFDFLVADHQWRSEPARVTLDIEPVDDVPRPRDDTFVVHPGVVAVGWRPLLNDSEVDGEPLRVVAVSDPDRGTVEVLPDQTLRFVPDAAFLVGEDRFTVTVADAVGNEVVTAARVVMEPPEEQGWPFFARGPRRDGHVAVRFGPAAFVEAWTWQGPVTGASVVSSVASGEDAFVVAQNSAEAWVGAIDLRDGSTRWLRQAPRTDTVSLALQGNVLVTTLGGMRAFDAGTGAERWVGPAISHEVLGGLVLGQQAWFADLTGHQLRAYDLIAGTAGPSSAFRGRRGITASAYAGELVVFSQPDLVRIRPSDGATIAARTLGTASYDYELNRAASIGWGVAFQVHTRGVDPGFVSAIDLGTMDVLWTAATKTYRGTPALADGQVFVLSSWGVDVLDGSSGRLLATSEVEGGISFLSRQPIVTDDTVIVRGNGRTHVLRRRDLTVRQVIPVDGDIALVGGRLLIRHDGKLSSWSAATVPDVVPTVAETRVATLEETPVEIPLAVTSVDPATSRLVVLALPGQGTLHADSGSGTPGEILTSVPAWLAPGEARLWYVPPPDAHGEALLDVSVRIHDGQRFSEPARVRVDVAAANDAPVAVDDLVRVAAGQAIGPLDLLANDREVDGDALVVVTESAPGFGAWSLDAAGRLRYQAPALPDGSTTAMRYRVRDPAGLESTATVTIEIGGDGAVSWPTLGGGPSRDGRHVGWLGDGEPRPLWSFSLDGEPVGLAVDSGRVVVVGRGPSGTSVTALHEHGGQVLWRTALPGTVTSSPPTIAEGRVYVQESSAEGDLLVSVLDASRGTLVARTGRAGGGGRFLAPLVHRGKVHAPILSGPGLVAGVAPGGAWAAVELGASAEGWTLSADREGDVFGYVGGVLSRRTGPALGARWSSSLAAGGDLAPPRRAVAVGATGVALVVNPAGDEASPELVFVDRETGLARWRTAGPYGGTPAVADGLVVAIHGDGLDVRAAADGRRLALHRVPGTTGLVGQLVVAADVVAVASPGRTHVLRRRDGLAVATLGLGGELAPGTGTLVVGDPARGVVAAYAFAPLPVLTSWGGTHDGPVVVNLGATSGGGRIHYTVDGSVPSPASRSVGVGGWLRLEGSARLRVVHVEGEDVGPIVEASFVVLDTDGDGMPDWREREVSGDPVAADGRADRDGDGIPDEHERLMGTDPGDVADRLRLEPRRLDGPPGTPWRVTWASRPGRLYHVETSTNLRDWSVVHAVEGNGSELGFEPEAGGVLLHVRLRVVALPDSGEP